MSRINMLMRRYIDANNQKRLRNKEFSILSSNCNGACICHDLGVQFRSPFVNLWMSAADFITFLENPKEYLAAPLEFVRQKDVAYPVARLKDVTLYFEHYGSEQEAQEQWLRRTARIDWDNLFVLMTERDGCTPELLRRFDALPYTNKVVFTHVPYPELTSAVYIPGFENEDCLGVCSEFVNGYSGRKWYDAFDYVSWLNGGK